MKIKLLTWTSFSIQIKIGKQELFIASLKNLGSKINILTCTDSSTLNEDSPATEEYLLETLLRGLIGIKLLCSS